MAGQRVGEVVEELRAMSDPSQLTAMARFGIRTDRALGGIGLPRLRAIGKRLGPDHDLALGLWRAGIHEARLLAVFVDDPHEVTVEQMDAWAGDLDSWDVCDTCATNLFDRTPHAVGRLHAWADAESEFVKRAAFAMIAGLALHERRASDAFFVAFLPLVEREAWDDRNYVRKGVNWALRQIGKRNRTLNAEAVACAERVLAQGTRSARWIARDAIRELSSPDMTARLNRAESRRARARR
ncbi:MAG TPA: DNA alkylation repair protein [Actinomycetota bacterium]